MSNRSKNVVVVVVVIRQRVAARACLAEKSGRLTCPYPDVMAEQYVPRYAAHQAAVLQYPLDDHLRTTVGLADKLRVAGVVAEQYARRKLVQKVGHLKIFRRQRLPRLLDEYRQR
uniref:Uncharacterized protein n=1 Tax=Anopheles melas TaxID=34690 RepID=A0A182UL72_9DIPT